MSGREPAESPTAGPATPDAGCGAPLWSGTVPSRLQSVTARRRPVLAVAVAAAATLMLAACGSSGSSGADSSPSAGASTSASPTDAASPAVSGGSTTDPSTAATGSASPAPAVTDSQLSAVKVTGAQNKAPAITFPTPFGVAKTQSTTLVEGSGPVIAKGQAVTVNYTGVNGRTGKAFDSSVDPQFQHVAPADFTLADGKLIPGFITGLVGQKIGSRVLIAIPPADGYGTTGNAQAGIMGTDTLLFVVDINSLARTTAAGTAVTPPASLPKVTVAGGHPTAIAKGPGTAPKAPVTQVLIRGDGPKVTASQTLKVQALVSVWRTGKTATTTWEQGTPVQLQISGSGVPKAFAGLVGQTVGSRVMVVSTPPTGVQPNADVTATDSLVYVFDILGAS